MKDITNELDQVSQLIDQIQQKVESETFKEGDYVMITKSGYGTSPADIGLRCRIVSTDIDYSPFSSYTIEIDTNKIGNNDRFLASAALRKLTKAEVLQFLIERSGLTIGTVLNPVTTKYFCSAWLKDSNWCPDFTGKFTIDGFKYYNDIPCAYFKRPTVEFYIKLEDYYKPHCTCKALYIGTNRHRIVVTKDTIVNEEGQTCTIEDLRELISPNKRFAGGYDIHYSTFDIGCVENVTRLEIESIIDTAVQLSRQK